VVTAKALPLPADDKYPPPRSKAFLDIRVSSPATDATPHDNDKHAKVTIDRRSDLSLTLQHVPQETHRGDSEGFRFTLANHGPDPNRGHVVFKIEGGGHAHPTVVRISSDTPDACSSSDGIDYILIQCFFVVPTGQDHRFTFKFRFPGDCTCYYEARVESTSDLSDPNFSNNRIPNGHIVVKG
jgi:hypothetical protein